MSKKTEKIRDEVNKKFTFIIKVLNSCENVDQFINTKKWGENIILNTIPCNDATGNFNYVEQLDLCHMADHYLALFENRYKQRLNDVIK